MGKLIDLTGQKFERLTVVERAEDSKSGCVRWKCVCDCGKEVVVRGDVLRRGDVKSCGCYNREMTAKRSTTHGGSQTRLYKIWSAIKDRCYNENSKEYIDYGGRGISMCKSWRDSFEVFRDWALENNYSDNLTIDRIDFNGNYEPNNCRWTTMKEQSNNRRSNHLLTYNGKTQTMTQWAEELGLGYCTLQSRINRDGWTVEEALTIPAGQPRNKTKSPFTHPLTTFLEEIIMKFEITEVCANCENEVTMLWDTNTDGFRAFCPFCGEELMLCDECQHAEDFNGCDWCKERGCYRKRQFEEKNIEKRLESLKYDFTDFSEKTYNRVKYAYDLMPVDDIIGKVYCGEICFEFCLEPDSDGICTVSYNVYYPSANSDYGFSKDVGNYDYLGGDGMFKASDFESLTYDQFKNIVKLEIGLILKKESNRRTVLPLAEKPIIRW